MSGKENKLEAGSTLNNELGAYFVEAGLRLLTGVAFGSRLSRRRKPRRKRHERQRAAIALLKRRPLAQGLFEPDLYHLRAISRLGAKAAAAADWMALAPEKSPLDACGRRILKYFSLIQ